MNKKVILLSGRMGSGKNQFHDYLYEQFIKNCKVVKREFFADYLKNMCKNEFKTLATYLNQFVEDFISFNDMLCSQSIDKLRKLKINDENWFENKTDLTRIMLFTMGNNIMRNHVDLAFWAKKTCPKIIEDLNSGVDVVIITDNRYINEIDYLKSHIPTTGIVSPNWCDIITVNIQRNAKLNGKHSNHQSENSLDGYDFDYVIDNNGSLEDLEDKAVDLVNTVYNFKEEN